MRALQAHVQRQRGFLLVLTMWLLVAIAIAAAYFGERVQSSLRLASARQDDNAALVAMSDARAELLFRLATTPFTPYGLGPSPQAVRLDNRPYTEGGSVVQLQDTGGLLNLNKFSDEQMQRFLGTMGVAADRRVTLIDTLRDYIDEDDLQRLNGAESARYRAAAKHVLPRNAALVSPLELRHVFGWSEQMSLWARARDIKELSTTVGLGAINANTAPWEVLTALPAVDEAAAHAIVQRRELEPVNAALLDRMLGTQMDSMISVVTNFPSGSVRITESAKGVPWALRYNVTLTPKGAESPWKITYSYRLEKEKGIGLVSNSPALTNASDPPNLPPRSSATASSSVGLFR